MSIFTVANTSKKCLSINKTDYLLVLSIPSATPCKKYNEEKVVVLFACFCRLISAANSANFSQTLSKKIDFWQWLFLALTIRISNDFRSYEYRSWIMNIWNHSLTRVRLQFQNFKFTSFSKSLKIFKSELDLKYYILSLMSSCYWC